MNMEHDIANLLAQPVTRIVLKQNNSEIGHFFDTRVKSNLKIVTQNNCEKTIAAPIESEMQKTSHDKVALTHFHNDENVFEIYRELKYLKHDILKAVNFVYQDVLNHTSNLVITNAWFNECEVGGSQFAHNHSNSVISGTYYIRTDENTNIDFRNRYSTSNTTSTIVDEPSVKKENKFNYNYHSPIARLSVRSGDCLIWPSHLLHGYVNNETPGRLSLSFNCIPETWNTLYKPYTVVENKS